MRRHQINHVESDPYQPGRTGVTLQTPDLDMYGRTIADVLLQDETNVNHTLVKEGWWWYRKYALGDTVLEGLEKEAREAKKGLWADPQPCRRGWEKKTLMDMLRN